MISLIIQQLYREINLSEATVRRAIRDLMKAGVITTEQRYRTKGSILMRIFLIFVTPNQSENSRSKRENLVYDSGQ